MLIDCDTCIARGPGCGDCVMTVILSNSAPALELDEVEFTAVDALAEVGLIPPLRLLPRTPERQQGIA